MPGWPTVDRADDHQLADALRRAEPAAPARLYDAYAERLHDYACSLTGDRDSAADAVHDAVVTAQGCVNRLKEATRLRAWLYALTRFQAVSRLPRKDDEGLPPPVLDDPDDPELAELVHEALGELSRNEREVLELSVRHGLTPAEVGGVLGLTSRQAATRLGRARDHVENAAAAVLLARTGRAHCPDLSAMVDSWEGPLTSLLRRRLSGHIGGCEVCTEGRHRQVSAGRLLDLVPVVYPPISLRRRVIDTCGNPERDQTRTLITDRGDSFDRTGFPVPPKPKGSRRRRGRAARTEAPDRPPADRQPVERQATERHAAERHRHALSAPTDDDMVWPPAGPEDDAGWPRSARPEDGSWPPSPADAAQPSESESRPVEEGPDDPRPGEPYRLEKSGPYPLEQTEHYRLDRTELSEPYRTEPTEVYHLGGAPLSESADAGGDFERHRTGWPIEGQDDEPLWPQDDGASGGGPDDGGAGDEPPETELWSDDEFGRPDHTSELDLGPHGRRRKRRRLTPVLLAGVAVLAATGAVVVMNSGGDPRNTALRLAPTPQATITSAEPELETATEPVDEPTETPAQTPTISPLPTGRAAPTTQPTKQQAPAPTATRRRTVAGARLAVSCPGTIDAAGKIGLSARNANVTWTASAGSGLDVFPAAGTIKAGGSVAIWVTVNDPAEGGSGSVSFGSNGGGSTCSLSWRGHQGQSSDPPTDEPATPTPSASDTPSADSGSSAAAELLDS